jgi:hypothetical protein
MNIEMILSDQHKKENEDIIKELKIQNTFIENKLQQISIFYITNKDKYNYELAKTFIDNLHNFIEETNSQFIKSNNYNLYLETIKSINDILPENKNETLKQQNKANQLFYSICNEEQDKLVNLIHINEKKLKIYENLLELYLNPNYNCDDDDNELEIKPEQNISVITNIIFLIMILFIIIVIMVTVFMIDQYHLPYNYIYNYDNDNEQCNKLFNKQSKLVI